MMALEVAVIRNIGFASRNCTSPPDRYGSEGMIVCMIPKSLFFTQRHSMMNARTVAASW